MSVLLRAGGRSHDLGGPPWLMGIVNATPDSFSDAGLHPTLESRVALARELIAAGAAVIDIGGESGTTNRPPVEAGEEIERVVPLIERVVAAAQAVHERPAGFYASYFATLNFSFDAQARAGLKRFFEELRALGAIGGVPPVEPEAFVVHH